MLPCLRRLFPDLQQLPPGELRVTDTAALLAAAAAPQGGSTAPPGRILVGAAAEAAREAAKKQREAAEAARGAQDQAPPKVGRHAQEGHGGEQAVCIYLDPWAGPSRSSPAPLPPPLAIHDCHCHVLHWNGSSEDRARHV